MSRNYDNWERLVAATLKRDLLRQLALQSSRESSFNSADTQSDLGVDSDNYNELEFEESPGIEGFQIAKPGSNIFFKPNPRLSNPPKNIHGKQVAAGWLSWLRAASKTREANAELQANIDTVEIKIKIDCEGCKRKVLTSVIGMKGVTSVEISPEQSKLTVFGYVDPEKVIYRLAHRAGKKAELWPHVPYDVVAHPYAHGVYDKKAPAGYVRNVQDPQM